jgi:hypothetical protein
VLQIEKAMYFASSKELHNRINHFGKPLVNGVFAQTVSLVREHKQDTVLYTENEREREERLRVWKAGSNMPVLINGTV